MSKDPTIIALGSQCVSASPARNAQDRSVRLNSIDRLQQIFPDMPADVRQMVETYQLFPLLLDARKEVSRVFGSAPIIWRLMYDPESSNVGPELFLCVQSDQSVPESMAKLDQLDNEWWLEAMPRANGRFNIDIEYS